MGEAKRKRSMTQHKIDLDWAFAAPLRPSQSNLVERLKPSVIAWAEESLPFLQARLALAPDGAQATMETRLANIESVWMFTAMIHNRDLGTSIVAMVATTEGDAKTMADAFMQAVEIKMGKPTSAIAVPIRSEASRASRSEASGAATLNAAITIAPMQRRPPNAPPANPMLHKELSWWAKDDGVIVGVVIEDQVDHDFLWVVFERNERGLYNAVDCNASLPTQEAAFAALCTAIGDPQHKTLNDLMPGVPHERLVEAMEDVTGVVFARCPKCGAPTTPGRQNMLCDDCYRGGRLDG